MHRIQKELIKRLVLENNQRFSTLTRGYDYEDNVVFHLKQLMRNGLVNKRDGKYYLSREGLEYSGKLNLQTLEEKKFKTVYLSFICKKGNEYLIREHTTSKRKFYKLSGGKPYLGETLADSCVRLFKVETGLTLPANRFKYHSIHFKTQVTTRGEVLFDNALVIYEVKIEDQDTTKMNMRQGTKWLDLKQVKKLKNKWPELEIVLKEEGRGKIQEYKFVSDYNIETEDL